MNRCSSHSGQIVALILALFSFALVACGSSNDDVASSISISTATVISSAPANGTEGVSRTTDVTITLSAPLMTTVDSTNVRLTHKNTLGDNEVQTTISYDEKSNTITVTPNHPLLRATSFRLTLSKIQDSLGHTINDIEINFKTRTNPTSKLVRYNDGVVSGYDAYTYDSNKRCIRSESFTHPGVDGAWFTGDDFMNLYTLFEYDGNGKLTREAIYSVGLNRIDYTYTYTYDESGNLTLTIYDKPFYPGDRPLFGYTHTYFQYSYDTKGDLTRYAHYVESGSDNTWHTDDDRVLYYYGYSYDSNEKLTRRVFFNHLGTDWVWYSEDDVVGSYTQYTYGAKGNITQYSNYSGAGADGIWFSDDDVVSDYKINVYDVNGFLIREAYYVSTGADGVWYTEDDILNGYTGYTYDTDGDRTSFSEVIAVGTDGVWYSTDDVLSSSGIYIPNF